MHWLKFYFSFECMHNFSKTSLSTYIRTMMISTKILNRDNFAYEKVTIRKYIFDFSIMHKKKEACLLIIVEMLLINVNYSYLLSVHTLMEFFTSVITNQFHNNVENIGFTHCSHKC